MSRMGAAGTAAIGRLKHAGWSRPIWRVLEWPVGLYFALRYRLWRRTSRVEVRGAGAAFTGPAVYVHWHRYVPFLIGHHGERRRWMLTSPAPYMEPAVRACRLLGLRVVRGGSGMGGRDALAELQRVLERGDSVALAVDGPAGPAFEVKRGCVDLAQAARVPVIPIRYCARHGHEDARRWDRMLHPRAFDRIVVQYGSPIDVLGQSPPQAVGLLQRSLDALETGRDAGAPFSAGSGS